MHYAVSGMTTSGALTVGGSINSAGSIMLSGAMTLSTASGNINTLGKLKSAGIISSSLISQTGNLYLNTGSVVVNTGTMASVVRTSSLLSDTVRPALDSVRGRVPGDHQHRHPYDYQLKYKGEYLPHREPGGAEVVEPHRWRAHYWHHHQHWRFLRLVYQWLHYLLWESQRARLGGLVVGSGYHGRHPCNRAH
jgi:hypothetical protein